jgi:hypothetical protein
MKIFIKEVNIEKLIIWVYFSLGTVGVTAAFFLWKPLLFVLKPLIALVLLLLYWHSSTQRNLLFFGVVLFSFIANIFFNYDTDSMLFIGIIAVFITRLMMIYYVIKLIQFRDYIPLFIAMIPFLFFFFYLLTITNGLTTRSYGIVIIQNVLISIIAGITFSSYVMHPEKKHTTWLLIFGILAISQQFIVFIEKYYLSDLSPLSFRPLAMILNSMVYFAFYKFVMVIEKSDDN